MEGKKTDFTPLGLGDPRPRRYNLLHLLLFTYDLSGIPAGRTWASF